MVDTEELRAMKWIDLMIELGRTSPDTFVITHVEANPVYRKVRDKLVRISVDYDSIIFVFTGKFSNKYKTRVRIWSDSRITASIELDNNIFFEYPVTKEDEHFDERLNLYGSSDLNNNPAVRTEIKELYDWTFNAYRNLVK